MVMRRYYEQIAYRPRNANARRSWWLARFAVLVCLIAAILVRFDLIETEGGLKALISGYVIAGLALVLSFLALVRIWRDDERGLGKALAGCVLSLAVLAVPVALQILYAIRPGMVVISSDPVEQPPFSRSRKAFDARKGKIPAIFPREKLTGIGRAYPDIVTLALDIDARSALEMVREIARLQGWNETVSLAPGGRFGDGHVDFLSGTFVLRLLIDITVRVRPVAGGSRVDILSAARFPGYDYADNTLMVRTFMDELAAAASAEGP